MNWGKFKDSSVGFSCASITFASEVYGGYRAFKFVNNMVMLSDLNPAVKLLLASVSVIPAYITSGIFVANFIDNAKSFVYGDEDDVGFIEPTLYNIGAAVFGGGLLDC